MKFFVNFKIRSAKSLLVFLGLAAVIVGGVFFVLSAPGRADSDTGFLTAATAVNGGGASGWESFDSGRVSDDVYAVTSKQERQVYFSDFNIPAIPDDAVINGIEVSVEGYTEGRDVSVAISWNQGRRMSGAQEAGFTSGSVDSTKIVGSPDDLSIWGNHLWTPEDFTDENFHIRIQSGQAGKNKEEKFFLDAVKVKVYYTLPVVVCTSWIYSDWTECSPEGSQTRTILAAYPENCVGGEPEPLMQACEYIPPVCTAWLYSDWSECDDGLQFRKILASYPEGCAGGEPEPLVWWCVFQE